MLAQIKRLVNGFSSYNTNILLAALISLLLVILFVLLLHIYATWFLSQARHHRRRSSSASVSHILRPSRLHNFYTFAYEDTISSIQYSPSKGMDETVIASIPLFVYTAPKDVAGLEYCVICLSAFEEEEIVRKLPKCGHLFHVECIDMWLHSQSSCPICRACVADNRGETKIEIIEIVTDHEELNSTQIGIDSDTPEYAVKTGSSSSSSMFAQ